MKKGFRERFHHSKYLRMFVIICGAILFYVLVNHIGAVWDAIRYVLGILAPIIVAALLAFLLNPIVQFFENKVFHKLKLRNGKYLHGFCVILVVVVLCGFLLLLLYLILSQLAVTVRQLISNFDGYLNAFTNMLNRLLQDKVNELNIFGINLLELDTSGLQEVLSNAFGWVAGHTEGIIGGAMSVGSNLFKVVIVIMLTVYMLLDVRHLKESVSRFFRAVMEPGRYQRYSEISAKGSRIFLRYFGSNLLDSLIIGVLCYAFMLIMKLPYALLIAVIVGVFNFVPTFGPIVGAVISAFLIILVDPWGCLWFIIYSLVSQFFDANLIKPKLFGDTTGLRPLWVLAAIIIFGGLFGVTGMLLGVPLVAIIAIVLNERVERKLQERAAVGASAPEAEEASQDPQSDA